VEGWYEVQAKTEKKEAKNLYAMSFNNDDPNQTPEKRDSM
jgi:hypothetical protein